jgi:hypothetical protein
MDRMTKMRVCGWWFTLALGIAKVMPIHLGHSNRVKQGLSVVQNGLVQRIPICNPTGTNIIRETSSIDADIDPLTKT